MKNSVLPVTISSIENDVVRQLILASRRVPLSFVDYEHIFPLLCGLLISSCICTLLSFLLEDVDSPMLSESVVTAIKNLHLQGIYPSLLALDADRLLVLL